MASRFRFHFNTHFRKKRAPQLLISQLPQRRKVLPCRSLYVHCNFLALREFKAQSSVRKYRYALYQGTPAFIAVGRVGVFSPPQNRLKRASYILLPQDRTVAGLIGSIAMVAVPDIIPLGIIDIVPNLMAVELPARRADHSVGEGVLASAPVSLFEPLGELLLDLGKGLGSDDRIVRILHQILLLLAVVDPRLLRQEVHHIGLLENGVALVLLVGQDAPNRADRPLAFPTGRRYALIRQEVRDSQTYGW